METWQCAEAATRWQASPQGVLLGVGHTGPGVGLCCFHKGGLQEGKEFTCQCRIHLSMQETQVRSLGREDPLERKWQPTPVFLPGKSCGQGSLAVYSLLLPLLLSRFSRVRLCATPQTAAHQAPPSLGFSRHKHWSGLPFPSPVHESEK